MQNSEKKQKQVYSIADAKYYYSQPDNIQINLQKTKTRHN